MKLIILVAVALAAVAVATPVEPEPATIVKSNFESIPEGGYVYSFETSDGVSRVETGELKEVLDENNKPLQVISVRGSYAYPDNNGNVVQINYHADDTGYHAEGDTIPKVPAGR